MKERRFETEDLISAGTWSDSGRIALGGAEEGIVQVRWKRCEIIAAPATRFHTNMPHCWGVDTSIKTQQQNSKNNKKKKYFTELLNYY